MTDHASPVFIPSSTAGSLHPGQQSNSHHHRHQPVYHLFINQEQRDPPPTEHFVETVSIFATYPQDPHIENPFDNEKFINGSFITNEKITNNKSPRFLRKQGTNQILQAASSPVLLESAVSQPHVLFLVVPNNQQRFHCSTLASTRSGTWWPRDIVMATGSGRGDPRELLLLKEMKFWLAWPC